MLAPQIKDLINAIRQFKEHNPLKANADEPIIQVESVSSRVGVFYERLRYSVDYKEEHLLRRNAIERILKRKLAFRFQKETLASSFVSELILAGYLPNNSLPERIIQNIKELIEKFIIFDKTISQLISDGREERRLRDKILSLAAIEIEYFLFPNLVEKATVDAFYLTIKDYIKVNNKRLTKEKLEMQIYIACWRSLKKGDEISLFYNLWLLYYPLWTQTKESFQITEMAKDFLEVEKRISKDLNHYLGWKLSRKLKDYAIYFSLITEMVENHYQNAEQIFENVSEIEAKASGIIKKKYQETNLRVAKSAYCAIIYILLTKIILAFIIELPYEMIFLQSVNYLTLGINVTFHPLLLFVITRSMRPPQGTNTDTILANIFNIIYGKKIDYINLRARSKRSALAQGLFVMYFLFFCLTFGLIIWFLKKLNFSLVGTVLFILFLTLVSYFGLRLRYLAKNWRVSNYKETFLTVLWDIFTLPIIQAGQWLSQRFAAINIFIFILDFIIETPFKFVLNFFDSFLGFLREKKEEMY